MSYVTGRREGLPPQQATRARAVAAAHHRLAATTARSPLAPLQRSIGNRAVGRLVEARLKLANPGDRLGRAVDRATDRGVRMPALGGGRPLPAPARAWFEPRFGRHLGDVRIHTDGGAAATARHLRARAFTAGRDVVFGVGEYAPTTTAGRSLLAHELAHVVQQAPGRAAPQASAARAEREAEAAAVAPGHGPLSARPVAVQRAPAPARAGMTRDEFAKQLKAIFGHDLTLEVGDKERQARELRGPPAKRQLPADWKAWDPGARAPLYDEILGAIEHFGREVGGVPDIRQIVFYDVRYVYDEQLNVVADPNAAAQMSTRRVMSVYRAALFATDVVAGGRAFSRSGVFLAAKASTAGKKGASAPLDAPTRAESQRRTVAHELGHGVHFATGALDEFKQAVGWVGGGAPRLYDIQAKGVETAIRNAAEPPAAARITKSNWNSGGHREQPMSEYAVTHPEEDFAESLMAWLYARDVLKARSPARFKFFDDQARRRRWLPKLVTGTRAAATRASP